MCSEYEKKLDSMKTQQFDIRMLKLKEVESEIKETIESLVLMEEEFEVKRGKAPSLQQQRL